MTKPRIILLLVALAACSPYPANNGYTSETCVEACASLERLGCLESRPTKRGVACVRLCEKAIRDGLLEPSSAACLARASTVDAIQACGDTCTH